MQIVGVVYAKLILGVNEIMYVYVTAMNIPSKVCMVTSDMFHGWSMDSPEWNNTKSNDFRSWWYQRTTWVGRIAYSFFPVNHNTYTAKQPLVGVYEAMNCMWKCGRAWNVPLPVSNGVTWKCDRGTALAISDLHIVYIFLCSQMVLSFF